MTREQLANVLSWVSRIAKTRDVLVYGSQSILGSYSENELPPEATGSMEVDITFFDDPDDDKSACDSDHRYKIQTKAAHCLRVLT